ncbi:hypothetical protein B0I37DRAFT_99463 [Chaetomium sp. MPI-CAGE-AT-0009]|nr:hypothetical protein B0I37DRAFT_99463 [Chaetomium sp. MPI-CAGE-AT-0009]
MVRSRTRASWSEASVPSAARAFPSRTTPRASGNRTSTPFEHATLRCLINEIISLLRHAHALSPPFSLFFFFATSFHSPRTNNRGPGKGSEPTDNWAIKNPRTPAGVIGPWRFALLPHREVPEVGRKDMHRCVSRHLRCTATSRCFRGQGPEVS